MILKSVLKLNNYSIPISSNLRSYPDLPLVNVEDIFWGQKVRKKIRLLGSVCLEFTEPIAQNTKQNKRNPPDSLGQVLSLSVESQYWNNRTTVVSSVMHVKDGCDYKKFMRNSSVLPTVYPHQRDRAGVRGELASLQSVWQKHQDHCDSMQALLKMWDCLTTGITQIQTSSSGCSMTL